MASAKTTRAARSKRTKDELINEMEMLESQFANAPMTDPTTAGIIKDNTTKTRAAASALSVDAIVTNGAQFTLSVQRVVQSLTEQAATKAQELKTLQEATEIEAEELERLYGIDVASASVEALIAGHKEQQQLFNAECDRTRAVWNEESTNHMKALRERNALVETTRARDEAEYAYRTQQARAKANDEFQFQLEQAKRAEAQRLSEVDKSIAERIKAITEDEAKIAKAAARVENLDNEVKTAVAAAVATATNALKSQLTHQFEIERAGFNNQVAIYNERNLGLTAANAKLVVEIAKVNEQLAAAKQQVTDITMKALESASGQQALNEVRGFAKENGTPRAKS